MEIIIKALDNDYKLMRRVQEFIFNQIKSEFGYGYVPQWHQDIVRMDEFYVNPEKNNFFVAFDAQSDNIIATIGLRAYDKNFKYLGDRYSKESTASIWRLFVHKSYRRCGLASKMFSIAENFARDCGFENIYLHTHKTYEGALEFWTKMGFVVYLDADDELQTVHMDKDIKSMELTSWASSFSYAIEF